MLSQLHKYNLEEPLTKEVILKYVIGNSKEYLPEIFKKVYELVVLNFDTSVK